MAGCDDSQAEDPAGRIEVLIRELERCSDPATRAAARALVAALLDMHGAGLARICELVAQAGPPGRALADAFTRDQRIAALLLLHGLHPVGLEARVAQALASVSPYIHAHGASVALREVADGVVRLRLSHDGRCCPSTDQALRRAIERAIDAAAPDAREVTIEGVAAAPGGAVLLPVLNGFIPS